MPTDRSGGLEPVIDGLEEGVVSLPRVLVCGVWRRLGLMGETPAAKLVISGSS